MQLISRPILVVAALVASAIGIGIYIAPSHKEIALMHMDDLDFSTALKNFSSLHEVGDNSINVLAPLINLNFYYGNVDEAIDLLKTFIAGHPKTVEGRKRLAELYKSSQRFNSYCDTLEEIQVLAPSTSNLRELANTYDFLGRYKDEMNALSHLIKSKGYRQADEDYMKLAVFYRVDHQAEQASDVLDDYIKDQGYKVKPEVVYLATTLFLEQDELRHAHSLAAAYLKKQGTEADAIVLSAQLESHKQFEMAYEFLTPFMGNFDTSLEFEKQVLNLLVEQKKDEEAYKLLNEQNARGALPPEIMQSLLDLAVNRKDYALIEKILPKTQMEDLPQEALLRYASFSIQSKHPNIAATIHDRLGISYLQGAELLNAVLKIAAHDSPENFHAVFVMPEDVFVTTTDRIVVAQIYLTHGESQKAFALLKSVPIINLVDMLDATDLATLYLDAGVPDEGAAVLAKARSTSEVEVQAVIDRVLLLIDVGMGRAEAVHEHIKHVANKNIELFTDAFDIAVRFQRNQLAAEFAERMYRAAPNTKNRLQLAQTLLDAGDFAKAVQYLEIPTETDNESRALYIDVVDEFIKKDGLSRLSDAQKQAFEKFVSQAALDPSLATAKKIEFADLLTEIGLLPQAENILVTAAANQPYDSLEVNELLGFWDDHPSDATTQWMENQARASSGAERLFWLTKLNDMDYPQIVLGLLRGTWNASPEIADQYIAALVTAHETAQLTETLGHAIAVETNPHRLKRLATIADNEDIASEAENAWRKLHQLEPEDSEATLQLGMLYFDTNRYDEAEPLLAEYLHHNEGSYRVNYDYGEILQQSDRMSDAEPYFERALNQLANIPDKSLDTSIEEATLLFYVGKMQQAITLFHRLVANNPANKELRADFAELLMESGQYDEASRLLSQ